MPALAVAGVGAVGSVLGGLFGSSASKKAAAIQQQNALRVAGMAGDAAQRGQGYVDQGRGNAFNILASNQGATGDVLAHLYDSQMGMLSPYQQAGTQGITSLADMMKPGGELTKQFSFNGEDLESDPGYQFQLQQGNKALNASAAARGALSSGGALKAMSNYNQGLAGTSFQNAYNRSLTSFQTNRSNTLQGLDRLIGAGQNANSQALNAGEFYGGTTSQNNQFYSGSQANNEMLGAQLNANLGMQGADIAGRALTGGANAGAAGTVGSANAWNGAIGGVTNAAQLFSLSQMMSPSSGGGPRPPTYSGVFDWGAVPGSLPPAPNIGPQYGSGPPMMPSYAYPG